MNTSNAPFSPNQRVVCVDDTFKKDGGIPPKIKKGEEFVIRDIRFMCCHWAVDIGIDSGNCNSICVCGKIVPKPTLAHWIRASRFAPIEHQYENNTAKIAESFTETIEYHDQKERIKPERVIQN